MKKKDVLNMSDKNLSDKVYIFFYYRVLKRLSESGIQNKDILEERSLNLKFKIIFYMK